MLTLAGLKFDVSPDLVFTDDQPLPVIRGNVTVNTPLGGPELLRLKRAIDDDERAIYDTPNGRAEIEIRSFVYSPGEGVLRHFEGLDVRSWTFSK